MTVLATPLLPECKDEDDPCGADIVLQLTLREEDKGVQIGQASRDYVAAVRCLSQDMSWG